MSAGAAIEVRGLTIRAGSRTLLERADADFAAGSVTLLVGASGSGKTVTMKVLAGLLEPEDGSRSPFEVTGSIRIGGEEVIGGGAKARGASTAATGIVFQNFALFDELSAADNVRFALDHGPRRRGQEAARPESFLEELRVPTSVPISALSGGQKQRLAIARTLAYDPAVLIYDEPTSGLDPANASRVAARIRESSRAHGKTTIVVTHDYANLAGIADAAYILDPEARRLVPIEPGALELLGEDLPGAGAYDAGGEAAPKPLASRAASTAARCLEATGAVLEKAAVSLAGLVPLWRSARWGLRYLRHYIALLASPSSWLYFGAAGLIAGFVSTHFTFKFLPHKKYTEPLIADDLLEGLGFALYRILTPVLITILIAARSGAAVASDVGNRVYNHQVDAMRSMGVRPLRYLLTGILHAFLIGTPLLVGFGFLAARLTSLVVYAYGFPAKGPAYWEVNFHHDLRIPGQLLYRGTGWLLLKVLTCGLGVGAIAYHQGMRPKGSGVDVSRSITTTILWATLYVLAVHFLFAFIEFE